MSAFRNTLARSNVFSAARRTIVVRQQIVAASRPITFLANSNRTPNVNKEQKNRKQGFATSLSFADFLKPDAALDKAQQYMDEGISFQNNNMLPLAMSSFQKSINERPTAAAYYNMGVCYFQLGDFQSSINTFQESLKLAPHHADVHTNIATAHIKLNGNMAEALNHLKAAANIAPQDAEIQFNLGVISEQTGDFDGAINAYSAAVDQGLETASINLRNVKTKKFAKLAKEAEFRDVKSE
ncbi:hypothetical protein BG011_005601 [Mortierella polycephala]|uniref:TPR-like protein n=1 Tax=Mortierella polycephala TaxID=41804 RepID=A0A9P6U8E3_9FUNG|nr:hypothetical protein BG011_005601 [Mortierella polycephala]